MCSVVSTTDELYTPTYRTPELFIDVANHMNVVTLLIAGSTRRSIFLYIKKHPVLPFSQEPQHQDSKASPKPQQLVQQQLPVRVKVIHGASQLLQGLHLRADAAICLLGCGLGSGERAGSGTNGSWSGVLFASKWRCYWSVTFDLRFCIFQALKFICSKIERYQTWGFIGLGKFSVSWNFLFDYQFGPITMCTWVSFDSSHFMILKILIFPETRTSP